MMKLVTLRTMQEMVDAITPGAGEKFLKHVTKKLKREGIDVSLNLLVDWQIVDRMTRWADTPEGHSYWKKINDRLYKWSQDKASDCPESLNSVMYYVEL